MDYRHAGEQVAGRHLFHWFERRPFAGIGLSVRCHDASCCWNLSACIVSWRSCIATLSYFLRPSRMQERAGTLVSRLSEWWKIHEVRSYGYHGKTDEMHITCLTKKCLLLTLDANIRCAYMHTQLGTYVSNYTLQAFTYRT